MNSTFCSRLVIMTKFNFRFMTSQAAKKLEKNEKESQIQNAKRQMDDEN